MSLGVGLIPVVPILLLPFILVFFVICSRFGIGAWHRGFLLLVVPGIDALAKRLGVNAFDRGARHGAGFRWSVDVWGLAAQKPNEARSSSGAHPRRYEGAALEALLPHRLRSSWSIDVIEPERTSSGAAVRLDGGP